MSNDWDKVGQDWAKLVTKLDEAHELGKKLDEAPRGDWGDWSDSAEQAGPYDDQPTGRDDEDVGTISLTFSQADVRTIQAAIEQRLDSSGILHHILDELGVSAGPDLRRDGPQEPFFTAR